MAAAGATFAFEAVDLTGAPTKGEIEAESKAQVAEQLRQRGLVVLDVSEKSAPVKIEDVFRKFKAVPMRDLSVASRQFATLVASGMPMLRALGTLEQQTEDEEITEAFDSVRRDVEAGAGLAQAMERSPRVFDRLYRSMVRSGEQSGRLEEALDRVAIHLEKIDNLRRQVKSALMYPALVFGAAIAAMIGIVAFIVPVFIGIFEDLAEQNPEEKAELPFMTKITVGVSDAITGYWFIVFPLVAFGVYMFFRWRGTEKGRAAVDRIKLKLPFKIGDVIQKLALARWSRTFSGSVSSGVPILQAIQITGETSGNVVVEEAMDDVYESVKRGGSIAGELGRHDIFPPMVANMVAVGEETGQLENMLEKIADFYEAEVDAKVKALTSLIEPILIVFIGAVVGFIVISMYLPIFSIYDKIR
jgi:type IV pilus assembly protein PilC